MNTNGGKERVSGRAKKRPMVCERERERGRKEGKVFILLPTYFQEIVVWFFANNVYFFPSKYFVYFSCKVFCLFFLQSILFIFPAKYFVF